MLPYIPSGPRRTSALLAGWFLLLPPFAVPGPCSTPSFPMKTPSWCLLLPTRRFPSGASILTLWLTPQAQKVMIYSPFCAKHGTDAVRHFRQLGPRAVGRSLFLRLCRLHPVCWLIGLALDRFPPAPGGRMIHCERVTKSYPMGAGRRRSWVFTTVERGDHVGFLGLMVEDDPADRDRLPALNCQPPAGSGAKKAFPWPLGFGGGFQEA